LPERIVPSQHLCATYDKDDAHREMLRRAARACGIAARNDLSDYFRMSPKDAAPRIDELVEAGELLLVDVEGWSAPGYLWSAAKLPRAIDGASLLSPFDPVVWYRPRAERLFGFHYRIEIYVPRTQRKWGYYVLPFRLGDRIAARVDLKADRKAGRLCVLSAHLEPGTEAAHCAAALATELTKLTRWLTLDTIDVQRNGDFTRQLAVSLARANRS